MDSPCALALERGGDRRGSLRCQRCELALERSPRGYLEAAGEGEASYPEDGNEVFFALEERSFWFRHRNAVLLALVERFSPGGAIWDVGGGNGFQAWALERAGFKSVLVEPGARGCANAISRGTPVVLRAQLQELGLRDGQIGAASFFDVLEHLEHPDPLLREAARALEPGGRVYVTVPAYELLWSEADDYAEHKTRYTAKRLRRLFGRAGLEVEYLSYYFQALALPIFALRTVPSVLRRALGRSAPRTMEATGRSRQPSRVCCPASSGSFAAAPS